MSERCALCPGANRQVWAAGPSAADYLFVGEAPGRMEDFKGVPFVGDAGEEFDATYLPLAGLDRAQCRVTNMLLCRPENNRTPSEKESASCSDFHLHAEIKRCQPKIIFLLGAVACRLVPSINLELHHGVPRQCSIGEWHGWVVPMYHPALGLHQTRMMGPMLEDWSAVRGWLRTGEWCWAKDECPETDYRLAKTPKQVDRYFDDHPPTQHPPWIGGDSESHAGEEYSLQISTWPGTGLMVRFADRRAMGMLATWLRQRYLNSGWELVFHNAPADMGYFQDVVRQPFQWRDTMQEAYHLGLPRQSLKVLGYRECGVEMQSWEDLVTAPSKEALGWWLGNAVFIAEQEWRTEVERISEKTGKVLKPKVVKHPIEAGLNRIIRHTFGANAEYPSWEKLGALLGTHGKRDELVQRLGAYPKQGIANVSLEEQVHYGCRDADVALRLAMVLEQKRQEMVRVYAEDRDMCAVRSAQV